MARSVSRHGSLSIIKKENQMSKYWKAGVLLLCAASSAMAQQNVVAQELKAAPLTPSVTTLDMAVPPGNFSPGEATKTYPLPLQLASASTLAPAALEPAPQAEKKSLFKPRLFTANKIHKYLGIGSMVLATATVFVDKGDDDENEGGGESGGGLHQTLGTGAAALGVAAVATGLTFHYDDLKFSNGLRDPDNLHALLGTLGTLGYLYAVQTAGDGGHAGAGILGAASMFYAIKLTW